MRQQKGFLCIVLHAHLPFVRHPEYEDFLEEDWLYEAITETYVPLIDMFDGFLDDKINFYITMTLTPTLCAMLSDELLISRYKKYLNKLLDLSEKEVNRTQNMPKFRESAKMYKEKLEKIKYVYTEKYKNDLIKAFRKFQDMGNLEIITCGATHGFLPLMINEKSVQAQIKVARQDYNIRFGREPRGIWLPECGYKQGIEDHLKSENLKFFFTDTHGLMNAIPDPKYGVYAPVYCPSGTACFARDPESSKQVWDRKIGYPGDYRYREFYRDVGYDLDYDYIKPYLHNDGVRRNIGIKYYKISGDVDLGRKQAYNPKEALDAASEHAEDFMFNRVKRIKYLYKAFKKSPIIVAPYDAELFGHWWYEGVDFLNCLFRKIHFDKNNIIETITPSQYLKKYKNNQTVILSSSTWGDKGYNEVWLNGKNDWIYKHLHKMSDLMQELAQKFIHPEGLQERALNQAARELLLAQASDWAFIMTTGTMTEYAVKRTKDHVSRFLKIYNDIQKNDVDEKWLFDIESRDNIFPGIDYRIYR